MSTTEEKGLSGILSRYHEKRSNWHVSPELQVAFWGSAYLRWVFWVAEQPWPDSFQWIASLAPIILLGLRAGDMVSKNIHRQ